MEGQKILNIYRLMVTVCNIYCNKAELLIFLYSVLCVCTILTPPKKNKDQP